MSTIITTTTAINLSADESGTLAATVIVILIALLCVHELTSGLHNAPARRMRQMLTLSSIPLLFVFAAAIVVKVAAILAAR